jgi:hypothetical protein
MAMSGRGRLPAGFLGALDAVSWGLGRLADPDRETITEDVHRTVNCPYLLNNEDVITAA